MRISKIFAGVGALALVAAPAIAQASMAPVIAPLSGDEEAVGDGGTVVLAIVSAAAILGAVFVAADSDNTSLPVSP